VVVAAAVDSTIAILGSMGRSISFGIVWNGNIMMTAAVHHEVDVVEAVAAVTGAVEVVTEEGVDEEVEAIAGVDGDEDVAVEEVGLLQ